LPKQYLIILIKIIKQFIQSLVVRLSTFYKEAFALQKCTDIANTINLVVSGLK
jgi:hypothetical protein